MQRAAVSSAPAPCNAGTYCWHDCISFGALHANCSHGTADLNYLRISVDQGPPAPAAAQSGPYIVLSLGISSGVNCAWRYSIMADRAISAFAALP